MQRALTPVGLELSTEAVDVRLRSSEIVLMGVQLSHELGVLGNAERVVLTLDPMALSHGMGATRRVRVRDGAVDLVATSGLPALRGGGIQPALFRTLSSIDVERIALVRRTSGGGGPTDTALVVDALEVRGLRTHRSDQPAQVHGQLRFGKRGRIDVEGTLAANLGSVHGRFATNDFPLAEFHVRLSTWGFSQAAGTFRAAGSFRAGAGPTDHGTAIAIDLSVRGSSRHLEANLGAQIQLAGTGEGEGEIKLRGHAGTGRDAGLSALFDGTIRARELNLHRDKDDLDGYLAGATWAGIIEGVPALRLDGRVSAPYLQLTRGRDRSKLLVAVTNGRLDAKGAPFRTRGFTASAFSADAVDLGDQGMTITSRGIEATQLYVGFDGETAVDELRVSRGQVDQPGGQERSVLQLGSLVVKGIDYRPHRDVRAAKIAAASAHYRSANIELRTGAWHARDLLSGQSVQLAEMSGSDVSLAARPWGELRADALTVTGVQLTGEATVEGLNTVGVRYVGVNPTVSSFETPGSPAELRVDQRSRSGRIDAPRC